MGRNFPSLGGIWQEGKVDCFPSSCVCNRQGAPELHGVSLASRVQLCTVHRSLLLSHPNHNPIGHRAIGDLRFALLLYSIAGNNQPWHEYRYLGEKKRKRKGKLIPKKGPNQSRVRSKSYSKVIAKLLGGKGEISIFVPWLVVSCNKRFLDDLERQSFGTFC